MTWLQLEDRDDAPRFGEERSHEFVSLRFSWETPDQFASPPSFIRIPLDDSPLLEGGTNPNPTLTVASHTVEQVAPAPIKAEAHSRARQSLPRSTCQESAGCALHHKSQHDCVYDAHRELEPSPGSCRVHCRESYESGSRTLTRNLSGAAHASPIGTCTIGGDDDVTVPIK